MTNDICVNIICASPELCWHKAQQRAFLFGLQFSAWVQISRWSTALVWSNKIILQGEVSNLKLSGQMTCLFAMMQFQLNWSLERWKSQWNWGGQSTKNWVFQMHSINLLWFPCASMGLVGLDTFMQDVSECDSLSGNGDVFDLCLGLKESDASQVVLLYPQRGTTFNHTHTNGTLK